MLFAILISVLFGTLVAKNVLFAIFGRLGDGKTLALTYLAFDHWFNRKEKIYANYHLLKIPFYYINDINHLNFPRGSETQPAFVCLDEVWRIINARTPMAKRNQIVYDILGRSRKRHLTIAFTSQLKRSMDKMVVDVLDFISKPSLSPDNEICTLHIFAGSKATMGTLVNVPRFLTAPFFRLFSTNEEVDMVFENETNDPPLAFQVEYDEEHGWFCECEKCGTKLFKTWEEAEKYANIWWETHWKEVLPENVLQEK